MIRVLIVEDDTNKLQKIMAVFSSIEDFDISYVTDVRSIAAAKEHLRQTSFDLLILDVVLPNRIDQLASQDAGIRLLEEILEREGYKVPTNIIGITMYPEALETANESFSRKLLALIYYDPTSDEWAQRLQTRLRQIALAKSAQASQPLDYQSHVAIICALEVPELSSVRQLPWNWKQIYLPNDNGIYFQGEIKVDGLTKIIYASAATRKGMPASTVLAMKMISAFRPAYLAMVGITAGISGRTNMGDIIVADPSWDWGSGKWQVKEEKREFKASPHQISLTSSLRQKFRMLRDNKAALFSIKDNWPAEKPNHELSLHIGPLASGASVLADRETAMLVKDQHRELLGIEMETYGVYTSAEECTNLKPSVFSMKSVVDFADENKDDRFQKYAAYTSAQALKYIVEAYL